MLSDKGVTMTEEQYGRWKDFAYRMARVVYRRHKEPSAKEIREGLDHFFGCLGDDWRQVVSWDHSDDYPEGHPDYRRTRRCPCWNCCPRQRGQKPEKPCPCGCEGGDIYDYAGPQCVGDVCAEMAEHWNPFYWSAPGDEDDDWLDRKPRYLGRGKGRKELYGPFLKPSYDETDDQWCGPVRCCLRMGLDLASEGSAGVLGFTAGDVRRMYPEGVPEWIARQWDDGKQIGVKAVCPGVGFVPEEKGPSERFEDMPDDAVLWS